MAKTLIYLLSNNWVTMFKNKMSLRLRIFISMILLVFTANLEREPASLATALISILYIPYVRTAVGKEKFWGFLSPSLKQGRDGFDISLPYFISLAPNYDLTLSPRYIEERGSGLAAEFRYLSKTSEGSIAASNIFQDRKFTNETNYHGNRWMAQWSHKSQISSNLFLDINTEGVSDNFFFENLNEDILGTKQKNYLMIVVFLGWTKDRAPELNC